MDGHDKTDILKQVRCPECFSSSVRMEPSVWESSGDTGLLVCQNCAKEMPLTDGILRAHPSALGLGASANLAYYDEMSEVEESNLAHRAASRNHATKMAMVMQLLSLENAPRKLILELGTGYGAHGDELMRAGHSYCGLDISCGLLRQARRRFPHLVSCALLAADGARVPVQDSVFDGVFCVATLHHLPEPDKGVQEMIRVLAKGGRFAFLEPKRFYPIHFVQSLRHSDTEISSMKMRIGAVKEWARMAGGRKVQVSYCVFTPNRPRFMVPVWNAIDTVCEAVHPLRFFSVMFCVHGTK
jgi:ubiquinone/menaquinone biosynthesis C-methylase UbiE